MRRAVSKLIPRLGRSENLPYRLDHAAVEDFYIALDHPHKSWLPGDEILGQVILILKRNLANIAIVFLFAGYVRINALHHLKLRAVKHVLFNHNIKIYGPETATGDDFANGLYKGEHRFPFIVKLPNKRVYTLLDFGKGAIEYVLKALLRSADSPAPLLPGASPLPGTELLGKARALLKLHLPTFTLERTIQLVNPIDVAELAPPKPKRLLIKDPRRTLALARVQLLASTIATFSTLLSNNLDSESIATGPTPTGGSAAQTPTLGVHASPSNASATLSGAASSPGTDRPSYIRVSMELGQRGFLRGELIPIKVSISHFKKIQDLRGVIVTLVRVCRLDYGPDGLYESFRKDLLQLVIPLYVDPTTLLLELHTSLRVPPDAFPTILGCPMVLFQYFVEVMLNLSGKPVSVDAVDAVRPLAPPDDAADYTYHTYASAQSRSDFINTDKFKRLKKFVHITSEVVIGTHRLERVLDASLCGRRLLLGLVSNPASPYALRAGINLIPEAARLDDFSIPPYPEAVLPGGAGAGSVLGQAVVRPNVLGDVLGSLGGTLGGIGDAHGAGGSEGEGSTGILGTPAVSGTPGASGASAVSGTPRLSALSAPTYDAVGVNPLHNLSEKERMRLHEASLLPSEPQFDASDVDDTVSPMDPTTDILDELISHENLDTAGSDMFQAGVSEIPDIHEGIGLEGAHDYVPNYDASGNDRLVIAGDQHSEHME